MPHLATLLTGDLGAALGQSGLVMRRKSASTSRPPALITPTHALDVNGWPKLATCRPIRRILLVRKRSPVFDRRREPPVPLDRRVGKNRAHCAMRAHEVVVFAPNARFTEPEEIIDGIQVYRHWISEEAGAISGFFREYSRLSGGVPVALESLAAASFDILHLCNPPDLLFLVAAPYKLTGTRIIYDVHDVCPEMFEGPSSANVACCTGPCVRRNGVRTFSQTW
ncbi:MAG: hypothetical protein CM1200mP29_11420 [Verrucomicrobiota bacterium]|nr:MAG: hypothetical protein CM1200mP29_11420 [Verrucomicrobiota bacterium]